MVGLIEPTFGLVAIARRAQRARADPPLPTVLVHRPAALFHLEPAARRSRLVQARLFLGDQALVVVRNHLGPRLESILGEPAHGQDELAAGDDVLQPGAPIAQWPARELAPVLVK